MHTQQNLYVVIEISDQLYCLYIISYTNISEILFKKASGQSCMFTVTYTLSSKGNLTYPSKDPPAESCEPQFGTWGLAHLV